MELVLINCHCGRTKKTNSPSTTTFMFSLVLLSVKTGILENDLIREENLSAINYIFCELSLCSNGRRSTIDAGQSTF